MSTRKTRGNALGGTLLVIVLLFIFGLTLANLATFDLRLVNRNGERQAAREAAEAGLGRVIAMIGENPTVGTNDEVFAETLPDGSSYRISFDPDDTDWSLNNLANLNGRNRGSNRTVPPNHCLIFAEGRSKAGESALIESLIRLEGLPYAVAGSNKVRSSALGVVAINGADIGEKASTYSGSDAADSTRLGVGSMVSGDVHSVGGASLTGAVVAGDVETGHDVVALPSLNIADFDTSGVPGVQVVSGGLLNGLVLSGPVYVDGDATFLAVTMANAQVYVNGDLTIAALLGSGAIFVNGKTTFTLPITFSGPNRITLFSDGDINCGVAATFQGVLLTHGNFTSGAALVVNGAIYANNLIDGSKGNVNLNGLLNTITHDDRFTAFASYWLALGGEAEPVQVYWNQLR